MIPWLWVHSVGVAAPFPLEKLDVQHAQGPWTRREAYESSLVEAVEVATGEQPLSTLGKYYGSRSITEHIRKD